MRGLPWSPRAGTLTNNGICQWRDELLAYFDEPTTNGYAEGVSARAEKSEGFHVAKRDAPVLAATDEYLASLSTDGGGVLSDGFCSAIEVTADGGDTLAADLKLPEK